MNMTTQELDKLVSSGQLSSEEFLPKFAKEIRSFVRDTGALEAAMSKVVAEQARFTTAWQLAVKEGFDEGAEGFAGFFMSMREAIELSTPTIKAFGRVFGATASAVGSAIRWLSPLLALVGSSFSVVGDSIARATDPEIPVKNLSFIQKALRNLAIMVSYVEEGFWWMALAFEKAAGAMGLEADGIGKEIASWSVIILLLLPIASRLFNLFRGIWSAATGAGRAIGRVLRLAGVSSKTKTKTPTARDWGFRGNESLKDRLPAARSLFKSGVVGLAAYMVQNLIEPYVKGAGEWTGNLLSTEGMRNYGAEVSHMIEQKRAVTVNQENNITIQGTTEQQARQLEETAKKAFGDAVYKSYMPSY